MIDYYMNGLLLRECIVHVIPASTLSQRYKGKDRGLRKISIYMLIYLAKSQEKEKFTIDNPTS